MKICNLKAKNIPIGTYLKDIELNNTFYIVIDNNRCKCIHSENRNSLKDSEYCIMSNPNSKAIYYWILTQEEMDLIKLEFL